MTYSFFGRLTVTALALLTPCTVVGAEQKQDDHSFQTGAYLSSRFAQNHHDWENAYNFTQILSQDQNVAPDTLKRMMVLAMGSGRHEDAIKIARILKTHTDFKDNSLVDLFLIVDHVKNKKHEEAFDLINALSKDSTSEFVTPFLIGWVSAAQGVVNIETLNQNTLHLHHAILISDLLGDHATIEGVIDHAAKVEDIHLSEIERLGDLYAHTGKNEKAVAMYEKILKTHPDDTALQNKIKAAKEGKKQVIFDNISSADQGLAKAFFDIADILRREQNDESARVFAHISSYLAPNYFDPVLLLAQLNIQHNQMKEAIALYGLIPENHDYFRHAQHKIADIYEDRENYRAALSLLQKLWNGQKHVDTMIKIGDLYRKQENFDKAIKSYSQALSSFNENVPEEYWHIYYVRGIAYEQNKDWPRAEEDLKTALSYQPDHPYVLNYLGYSWADQNMNLAEAQKMIEKAVDLRPSDGHITDSLGWVLYRVGKYKQAVRVLEKAVELLPYDPIVNDHLGDAYWKTGRTREARFQWQRAKNHSDDEEEIKKIEKKLQSGLD